MSQPQDTVFDTGRHGDFNTDGPAAPSSTGKAPANDTNGGFQPSHKMAVQPPKKDDLQRSYATVVDANANPEGWYGTMSKSPCAATTARMTTPN